MPPDVDYYKILQVHRYADPAIIKSAYRTIMGELRIHPDRGGSTKDAQLLNEAYETLSDPVKRSAYDLQMFAPPNAVPPPPEPQKTYPAAPPEPKRFHTAPNTYNLANCPTCGKALGASGQTPRQTRINFIRQLAGFEMHSGYELSNAEAEEIAFRLIPN